MPAAAVFQEARFQRIAFAVLAVKTSQTTRNLHCAQAVPSLLVVDGPAQRFFRRDNVHVTSITDCVLPHLVGARTPNKQLRVSNGIFFWTSIATS